MPLFSSRHIALLRIPRPVRNNKPLPGNTASISIRGIPVHSCDVIKDHPPNFRCGTSGNHTEFLFPTWPANEKLIPYAGNHIDALSIAFPLLFCSAHASFGLLGTERHFMFRQIASTEQCFLFRTFSLRSRPLQAWNLHTQLFLHDCSKVPV